MVSVQLQLCAPVKSLLCFILKQCNSNPRLDWQAGMPPYIHDGAWEVLGRGENMQRTAAWRGLLEAALLKLGPPNSGTELRIRSKGQLLPPSSFHGLPTHGPTHSTPSPCPIHLPPGVPVPASPGPGNGAARPANFCVLASF